MAHITSRKHGPRQRPTLNAGGSALALAALALPAVPQAQQTTASPSVAAAAAPGPAASAPARVAATSTLPEVQVRGTAPGEYKADAVASPKFTQPLVDTPQTITVIRKEVLQQQGAVTLGDALRNTPGITMLAGENGNTATGDSIFMRGFDTQGSIFVDGIRDLGGISRDTFNIEQVEVVKGPSGSDNGRGAASGYVNLVTKQPSLADITSGSASVSSGGRGRVTADVNRAFGGPMDGAVRLNVFKQEGGIAGRDEVKSNTWGVAPSLGLGLGTSTRAIFSYLHAEQRDRPDGGVPTVGLDGFYNAAFDAKPSATWPAGGPQALAGRTSTRPVDRENYYGASDDYNNVRADMFTARFEHDFAPGTTLRNTSRWGRTEQHYLITGVNALGNLATVNADGSLTATDPSAWTVDRTRQGRNQRNELLTNQTNLNTEFATGAVTHALSTGIEFIHEKQSAPSYALPAGTLQQPANLYRPDRDDPFQTPVPSGAYSDGSTTTVAVYAFDTLKLTEQFQLTAGLRYERFKTDFDGISLSTLTANPTLPVGTQLRTKAKFSDDLLSWKLGAVWKPAANGSVYLTASTSYLPPGGTNFQLNTSSVNANNPDLDPQKATNLELGTKWDLLGGRLALTAAVFRSENSNEIVTNTTDVTETLAVGKRTVEGVELGAVGQLTKAWQLIAGLAYMDPKIDRGSVGGTAPTDGGVIQWTPKLSFTAWTTYKLPMGLTLGGGARYVDSVRRSSSTIATSANTNLLEVPSYWVFDAMAAYEVTKNVSLQLNVYNLADKDYIASLNNSGARYYPGTPRSAQLSVNVDF